MSKIGQSLSKGDAWGAFTGVVEKAVQDGLGWGVSVVVFYGLLFTVALFTGASWKWVACVFVLLCLLVDMHRVESWVGVAYFMGYAMSTALMVTSTLVSLDQPWISLRWVLMVLGILLSFVVSTLEILLASETMVGKKVKLDMDLGHGPQQLEVQEIVLSRDISWYEVIWRPIVFMVVATTLFGVQWERLFEPILGAGVSIGWPTWLRAALQLLVNMGIQIQIAPTPGP